ncbi:MAG: hypothetical protein K8J09_18340, partial [Planctomycetes bacterium]|nr:hypothetical protein [Planctomycetota bacterium]
MPGLYLLQVGEVFYQYGGPLETGASPQTTAVYADYNIVEGVPNQVPEFAPTTKYVYTNNLSGAQLWRYVTGSSEYVEVRHVDGSVAHFESFNPYVSTYSPSPTRNLWRITWVRDPYDNQSDYTYNSLHQLTEIAFPSGIQECFNYLPSWRTGWPSGSDCIEISYKVHGSTPTEAAAKTWAMVFSGTAGTAGGHYFGKRLYRTYSAPRDMLVAASSGQPYGGDAQSVANGQIVHEFQFNDGTRTVTEVQKIHDGSLFAASLSTPAGLSDLPFLRTASGSNGRVVERTKVQEGETLTFSYPSSGFRTTDLLAGTQMSAIESTNGTGTVRRYEFDYRSGRLYSVFITPSDNSTGHPRASHATGENATI